MRRAWIVLLFGFACAVPARADAPSVFAWPGAAGGLIVEPGSIGASPTLSVSWRPWSFLEPELGIGSGAFLGTNDYMQRFSFGSRLVLPNESGIRPFLWAAFTHAHEVPFETVIADPIFSLFGFSEAGVEHRSGGEAGVGVLLPLTIAELAGEPQTIDVLLRLTGMYLPDFGGHGDTKEPIGDHLYTMLEISIGLPLSFDPDALQPPRLTR